MIACTNRRGDVYYLHESKTKTGKPMYFFSMKSEATLDRFPDGFEVYENPNAQVFLRRIPVQVFTPEEIETVKLGVNEYALRAIVDVKGKNIIVFLCDQDVNEIDRILDMGLFPLGRDGPMAKKVIMRLLTYSPMMQFVLKNAKTREFVVERWCFQSSVDDWIELDRATDLKELIKTYVPHLGQDSFFDL
jgi:hypothetical protein